MSLLEGLATYTTLLEGLVTSTAELIGTLSTLEVHTTSTSQVVAHVAARTF